MTGRSRTEAMELAEFYLRGRESSTLGVYGTEYRKLAKYCAVSAKSVFEFDEVELMAYLVARSKEGISEGQMKQALSVVALIFEACGWLSPSKSPLVIGVKKAILKDVNKSKRPAERVGMTRAKLVRIVDACYDKDCGKVSPERRRFLIMQLVCFLGAKRFGDIRCLRRRDVSVDDDDRVRIWLARSKTDSLGVGSAFKLTKAKIGQVSVTTLVRWYLRSLGDLGDDSYVFPVFREGVAVGSRAISYCAARKQLLHERVMLGLGLISWHSGRIGGATEASKKGLSRSVIMKAGGWRSSAVDSYIRVDDAGVQMGDAVL